MIKVLVIIGHYLPGNESTGPVTSIRNLSECIGDDYEINVLTKNDQNRNPKYRDICIGWNRIENTNVWYTNNFTIKCILNTLTGMDLVYLCGTYNDYVYKTLILKRLNVIRLPIIIAPMGNFSEGALRIKYKKKLLYFRLASLFGLFKRVYWSVTSEYEARDINTLLTISNNRIFIAEDIPRKKIKYNYKPKENEILRIVWLSRISPKKNLSYTAEILRAVKKEVVFDIYGPINDNKYWSECLEKLHSLPENIHWEYKGEVSSSNVYMVFSEHDVFLFNTLGENYGHVIIEALSGGCICLLSDNTPWTDLQRFGVGYNISNDKTDLFVYKIEELANMTNDEINAIKLRCAEYAQMVIDKGRNASGYKEMFSDINQRANIDA